VSNAKVVGSKMTKEPSGVIDWRGFLGAREINYPCSMGCVSGVCEVVNEIKDSNSSRILRRRKIVVKLLDIGNVLSKDTYLQKFRDHRLVKLEKSIERGVLCR
jgi:hypothetical protein